MEQHQPGQISTPYGFASTAMDVIAGTLGGVARYAVDPDNAARLWEFSETLVAQAEPMLAETPA